MMSGFEMTSMILTSCQALSVHSCSIMTNAMYFALLFCSASQVCTECCLEVTAVQRLSNISWAAWVCSAPPRCLAPGAILVACHPLPPPPPGSNYRTIWISRCWSKRIGSCRRGNGGQDQAPAPGDQKKIVFGTCDMDMNSNYMENMGKHSKKKTPKNTKKQAKTGRKRGEKTCFFLSVTR